MADKEAPKSEETEVPRSEPIHHKEVGITPQSKAPIIGIAIALGLIVLLIGAGSGFLAGIAVGKHTMGRSALGVQTPMYGGRQAPGYQGQAGRGVSRIFANTTGTVTDVSSSSISVKTNRGTTVSYIITGSTTVSNSGNSASVSDIKVGDTVSVRQTTDTTGDAASIQINP